MKRPLLQLCFWLLASTPFLISAQGVLVSNGGNVAMWGVHGGTGLASDNTSVVGPSLGYSIRGMLDFRVHGGRFFTPSELPNGNFLGGEVEIHVLKEFPSPFGLSLQAGLQSNYFPKRSDFFTLSDFSTYALGGNLYKVLGGDAESRKTIFFISPAYVGLTNGMGLKENYISASTGFWFNTSNRRSIVSVVPVYGYVFSDTDRGSRIGLSILFNYPNSK